MNDNKPYAKFQFRGYLIESATINIQSAKPDNELGFSIIPNGVIDYEKREFALHLDINVADKEKKFNVDIKMSADFTFEANDSEKLMNYIGTNAPAIIFPYIRAYVSNITALSGMQPIIMPTLNMSSVGKRLVEILRDKVQDEEQPKME